MVLLQAGISRYRVGLLILTLAAPATAFGPQADFARAPVPANAGIVETLDERVSKWWRSQGPGYGSLNSNPDRWVGTSDGEGVNVDLYVDSFFHEHQTNSNRGFLVAALNPEMELESLVPDLAKAPSDEILVAPEAMILDVPLNKSKELPIPRERNVPDQDGLANALPTKFVEHLVLYWRNFSRPATYQQTRRRLWGQRLFTIIQCNGCHAPDLVIERDQQFAGGDTHSRTYSLRQSFTGEIMPVDFKRQDRAHNVWKRHHEETITKELMTEPRWSVGSRASEVHEGRSIKLREVILKHDGKAQTSRDAFARLPLREQSLIIEFLQSFVLRSHQGRAFNRNPGDSTKPNIPQKGHGRIDLPLFLKHLTDPN